MPLRPGYFDSLYVDTTAAVLRDDGILLIYNGINANPQDAGTLAASIARITRGRRCSTRATLPGC